MRVLISKLGRCFGSCDARRWRHHVLTLQSPVARLPIESDAWEVVVLPWKPEGHLGKEHQMAYGSYANWAGNDISTDAVTVNWTTGIGVTDDAAGTPNSLPIPIAAGSTAEDAAAAITRGRADARSSVLLRHVEGISGQQNHSKPFPVRAWASQVRFQKQLFCGTWE